MPTEVQFDFSEWLKYSDAVQSLLDSNENLNREFLANISSRFINEIKENLIIRNYTGTYFNSINYYVTAGKNPVAGISINPIGAEAARLPIYYKVLEFGSGPIPLLPRNKIVQWAIAKGFDVASGLRIASSIQARGVKPHPILQSIFLLDGNANITGITPLAQSIVNQELEKIMSKMDNIFSTSIRTGKKFYNVRNKLGRFTSIKAG